MAKFTALLNEKSENINIDISVDNLKSLTSGIIFTNHSKPITLDIDDVKIIFCFIEKDQVKESSFEPVRISDKEMKVNLINFNNPLGQGKIDPLNFVITESFNIYVSFYVTCIDQKKGSYQMYYSIQYGGKND